MLETIDKPNEDVNYKDLSKALQLQLSDLQQKVKDAGLPVIILFEGCSASGKGSLIASMIKRLDPRNFKVHSTLRPDDSEKRYPFLKRFWTKIPEYGKMSILDRSWYQDISIAKVDGLVSDFEAKRRTNSINTFERQLTADGYLIVKFFLHITQEEQKRRLEKLESDSTTQWRVNEIDWKRNENYDKYFRAFDKMIEDTNKSYSKWHIIDAKNKAFAKYNIFKTLVGEITTALEKKPTSSEYLMKIPTIQMPKLEEVNLKINSMSDDEYEDAMKKGQKALSKLHNKIYLTKTPVILAFEGWDAAGKGGSIKRVASSLDPRGYEAIPIAAPDRIELNHHYLWRFWNNVPKEGHLAIFDRSWYGRVMVERIEGFTSVDRWKQAYQEINEFEKELYDSGAIIMKFWMQIDKHEQLQRFTERQNTPSKQWKITEEDWRNRNQWDNYEIAVNEMLQKTSTQYAPWFIIEANDKYFARIKTIETIIDNLQMRLK